MKRLTAILLALLLVPGVLTGCTGAPGNESASGSEELSQSQTVSGEETELQVVETGLHPYLRELVRAAAEEITTPEMTDYEKVKAAFDYMIAHTSFEEPVGLDLWRVHGGGDEPIDYIQERALSPLRFGLGTCEDYAAALKLLLEEMGFNAAYVPGLTYSAEGHLVDHAWTAVELDGVWYHLDSQLEDNIVRNGTVRYRYFLKGDETMSASHRWGQNLIDAGLLTEEQNEEIRTDYLLPDCPQDYPATAPEALTWSLEADPAEARAEAQAEIEAYEAEHGPLEPMELDTVPPVFGLEGYGPADEG